MRVRGILLVAALMAPSGCGVFYTAPGVSDGVPFGAAYKTDYDVKVVPLTYESAAAANLVPFVPARLPLAFQPGAVAAAAKVSVPPLPPLPPETAQPEKRPGPTTDLLPPPSEPQPYRIGVSDVLLLSVNTTTTLEALPGLISAQAKRQGYIVQDDGAIAIPDAGRVMVAGMTLQDAEAEIFRALVAAKIDPSFSLEITDFNSQRVSIGGLVTTPQLIPITLKPLYLNEAIDTAGGVGPVDPDYGVIRLFRGGTIYQIGVKRFLDDPAARHIVLKDGDSIFVGTRYRTDEAERYFNEQLQLREQHLQGTQFQLQLEQIRAQRESTALQRLADERELFKERLELGAVERGYAYRTGEVRKPGRVPLPFERTMSLADVLFEDKSDGMNINYADYGAIYVIRADASPERNGGLTAYHLDAENAVNLAAATQFQIRPNDVVFVAEQPITSWNRAISQILPQIFFSAANIAGY